MEEFDRLVRIMDDLRDKCPWDRKQTVQSLREMTIEETYELSDAVLENDWSSIKEELGDLLLHIVFYSKIADEEKHFSIKNVINDICEKLIKRHPHVYPPEETLSGIVIDVKDENDVKQNWEKLKIKEGKKSVLGGIPKGLPSVVKAMRLQEKAKQVGFEWTTAEDVWSKVKEELDELHDTAIANQEERQEEEFGDVLFSLINYSRFLGIDADAALERTNKKFKDRFTAMEEAAKLKGKLLDVMTLEEMDAIWNEIKLRRT